MPRKPSLPRLQELLGLLDWHITLEWASAARIKREVGVSAYGCIQYEREHRKAHILLLPPDSPAIKKTDFIRHTPQFWLLHELLHLVVEFPDDPEREETTINALARAFDSLL